MAVRLEYCSIIVPIQTIDEKLGQGTFARRFRGITEVSWHDAWLFREGCMNSWDLEEMLDAWERRGFDLITTVQGQEHWKDLCVAHSGHGPSYPCPWLAYDPQRNIVWLQGHEPGVTVGPSRR